MAGEGEGGERTEQHPEWMDALPARLQASPDLRRFKSVETLADALLEGRRELSRRPAAEAVIVPDENSPEDVVKRFRENRGIPENMDGYQLSGLALDPARPEFVPNDAQKAAPDVVRKLAHELGMSQEQAAGVTKMLIGQLTENVTSSAEQRAENDQKVADALREKFGAELDQLAQGIEGVYKVLMPDDEEKAFERLKAFMQKEFHPGGVGNSLEFREILVNVLRGTKADRFVRPGNNPGQEPTPDPSRARLDYSKGRGPVGVRYD